ncbi:hypothetical protein LCGC14_3028560, partial [marine sediment metagenome]
SNTDPLLFLEFHRQFTHSLFFIPIGGLICALVLQGLINRHQTITFKQCWIYCTLGYATHGLLDACTTYGTQLFWPFSNVRIAWNTLSIIDPIYTLPLLVLVLTSIIKHSKQTAQIALCWVLIYPTIGMIQRDRAEQAAWLLAKARNHQPLRLEAKPSFANILLWKTIYETDSNYYVDAIRVGSNTTVFAGEHIKKLDLKRDLPWLDTQSQQAKDIERFRWFSNGYIAQTTDNPLHIADIRYSMVPNQIKAMWLISVEPTTDDQQHAAYETERDLPEGGREELMRMLFNR